MKQAVLRLWQTKKLNTHEIGKLLHIPEEEVADIIHEHREAQYAEKKRRAVA